MKSSWLAAVLTLSTTLHGSLSAAELTPLTGAVLEQPWEIRGSDGRNHLVYEVRLDNVTQFKASLDSFDVIDEASGASIASLDHEAIGERLSRGGARGQETSTLGPAEFGVLFLHVSLATDQSMPKRLIHQVRVKLAQPGMEMSFRLAPTDVILREPPRLGPPLRGSGYVAADGCCDTIRHVRALLAIDGAFHLSQRFAIDWEQADRTGKLVVGDLKDPKSYRVYGADVLAVADGTVVDARNDLPDQVPGALPQRIPLDEADGNFVVLDIGGGAFVNYAHMQPGSVRVTRGTRVKRGDLLGLVGNSGNSQAPHLHLHVMDGPSPLVSNGLPYVFDDYAITAEDRAGTQDFDHAEATGSPLTLTPLAPPARLENALPLDLTVVDWAN